MQFVKCYIMKQSIIAITLILSVLAFTTVSCNREKKVEPTKETVSWSPEPGAGGSLPNEVLPSNVEDTVTQHFTVHTGETPAIFEGQFVSSPHVLLYSTIAGDTTSTYNDRYIAFQGHDKLADFYGQQWDDVKQGYYYEAYRNLNVIGTGDNFTCYYLTEGYPNGMYAKQSTIFSGKWNESYGGLKDFQVAVILLETSNNPNLEPANSFRVLCDGDGLAQDTTWIISKESMSNLKIFADDAFDMFRVR